MPAREAAASCSEAERNLGSLPLESGMKVSLCSYTELIHLLLNKDGPHEPISQTLAGVCVSESCQIFI